MLDWMWGREVNEESNITGLKPEVFWAKEPEDGLVTKDCWGLGFSDVKRSSKRIRTIKRDQGGLTRETSEKKRLIVSNAADRSCKTRSEH